MSRVQPYLVLSFLGGRRVPGALVRAAGGAPLHPSGRSRWPPRALFGAAPRPRGPPGPGVTPRRRVQKIPREAPGPVQPEDGAAAVRPPRLAALEYVGPRAAHPER